MYPIVVCAWCNDVLRWKESRDPALVVGLSHGMCPTCAEQLLREAREARRKKK